jgi:hypothetical protein
MQEFKTAANHKGCYFIAFDETRKINKKNAKANNVIVYTFSVKLVSFMTVNLDN